MTIAWIEAEKRFMSRDEREKVMSRVFDAIKALQARGVGNLTADDKYNLGALIDEHKRLKRIHDCEVDLLRFCYEYFGEVYNAGNDGNWIPCEIVLAPQFHREICADMDYVSNVKVNAYVAEAAPRSHAKSSFLSKGFPLREIGYRKRKYAIIVSETPDVSESNMLWLSNQLKYNEKFRADFGPLLDGERAHENPKDNSSAFVAWHYDANGRRKKHVAIVQAVSANQALRGRNWNGHRPDLIICDDLEGKKNTNTPELRKATRHWFKSVVMPLGDPEGKKTAIVYMGTVVCDSSLLMHVIEERSDFKSRIYKAVIEWPERMDLWAECQRIYQERENPNRAGDARAFYDANKDEMDRGAVVLWPDVQPLWKLMAWKWDNGSFAFSTEYQNEPIDEESQVFNADTFRYWSDDDASMAFPRRDYAIHTGIDFAMGKDSGDYSALVTIARHKKNGAIYVVDAFGARQKPHDFIDEIVRRVMRWEPDSLAAEAVGGWEATVDELKRRLSEAGYPARRVDKLRQNKRGSKSVRIESLHPLIENHTIRFNRAHVLLLEQLEKFGTKTHDDLPDALEMAVQASKKTRKTVKKKPKGM